MPDFWGNFAVLREWVVGEGGMSIGFRSPHRECNPNLLKRIAVFRIGLNEGFHIRLKNLQSR